MTLTAAQANSALATVTTLDGLRALISQVDISSTGTTTVLYSGMLDNGVSAHDIAKQLSLSDPNIRIIDNTQLGIFLDTTSNQLLVDKLQEILGSNART